MDNVHKWMVIIGIILIALSKTVLRREKRKIRRE